MVLHHMDEKVRLILEKNQGLAELINSLPMEKGQALIHFLVTSGVPAGALYGLGILNAETVGALGGTLTAASILAATHGYFSTYRYKEEESIHGSARFARAYELKRAGLTNRPGIVFGRTVTWLTSSTRPKAKIIPGLGYMVVKPSTEDGHVAVLGGTGSGKTKSHAIPSILNWDGAGLYVDLKGELVAATAQVKENVFVFDPTRPDCAAYDPVRLCETLHGAQEIAETLIPDEGKDPFWSRAARAIFTAALLEGYEKKQSLVEVSRRCAQTSFPDLLKELIESEYSKVRTAMSLVRDASAQMLASVLTVLRSHLQFIAEDEALAHALRRSDWTFADLEKGANIYLSIPESLVKLPQYKAVFNIILNQCMTYLANRSEGKTPPILLMIDELPRWGYIPSLLESLATLRSRNVHMVLIFQGFSQLQEIYKPTGLKTILQNCEYKLILKCTEPESQKYLSELAGNRTVRSYSGSSEGEGEEEKRNWTETSAPLIRPEEWGRAGRKAILFTPHTYPVELNRVWYNEEPRFAKLLTKEEKQQASEKVAILRPENNTIEA